MERASEILPYATSQTPNLRARAQSAGLHPFALLVWILSLLCCVLSLGSPACVIDTGLSWARDSHQATGLECLMVGFWFYPSNILLIVWLSLGWLLRRPHLSIVLISTLSTI